MKTILTIMLLASDKFDVRQFPCLVEKGLLRPMQAEENLKFSIGAGGNPVRLLACRRLGPEVDIHRTVGVLLKPWGLGGAAGPLHVADQRMGRRGGARPGGRGARAPRGEAGMRARQGP